MAMPEPRRGSIERIETAVFAVVVATAVIGLSLLPLTTSPYVEALVAAVGSENLTGLGHQGTLDAAEAVRRFVLDPDAQPLPAEIGGIPAFDAAAVSHLVDVRSVMVPARRATFVLAALAVAWVAVRRRTRAGREALGHGLTGSVWVLVTGAALGVVVGLLDFSALFTWFHGLFFEPGTWVFPDNALLIRVFPLVFWIAAGATWGLLVLGCSGLLFVAGRRLRFTRGAYGV
jgi:hypothetical protein